MGWDLLGTPGTPLTHLRPEWDPAKTARLWAAPNLLAPGRFSCGVRLEPKALTFTLSAFECRFFEHPGRSGV